jgi:hypothetical protein
MSERRCRYCEKAFHPSKRQPRQTVCSQAECQKKRCAESRRKKLASDGEYRQVCLDSACKWRAANPEYWKRYREKNPESVAHNRQKQQNRDRKQQLLDLANNNSVLDLKRSAASIWLLNPSAEATANLANNNSVPAQVWVIEPLAPRKGPAMASCKQQRAGVSAASAG